MYMMTKRLFRILTFLLSSILILLFVFYRDISFIRKKEEDISVIVITEENESVRTLPYGSRFSDLDVRSTDYAPEYVLHNGERIYVYD